MIEVKHTPTPWCVPVGEGNESLVCRDIDGRAGDVIFGTADKFRSWQRRMTLAECHANAALIVRAVNRDHHFDALVTALREAERFIDYFAEDRTSFVGPGTPKSCLAQIRAALSAIEGEAK